MSKIFNIVLIVTGYQNITAMNISCRVSASHFFVSAEKTVVLMMAYKLNKLQITSSVEFALIIASSSQNKNITATTGCCSTADKRVSTTCTLGKLTLIS